MSDMASTKLIKDEAAMYESPETKKEVDGVHASPPKSILKLRSMRTSLGFLPV